MRSFTFAVVMLAVGSAGAQTTKTNDAVASARAFIDKADEAFNAHDAKAMEAMLDKSIFAAGPTTSARFDDYQTYRAHLDEVMVRGGHVTRDGLTLKADGSGDCAWYIAEYTFVPKAAPGVMAVSRKLREAGVLVRRGKEWKLAMSHLSLVQPDPATPTAPTKK